MSYSNSVYRHLVSIKNVWCHKFFPEEFRDPPLRVSSSYALLPTHSIYFYIPGYHGKDFKYIKIISAQVFENESILVDSFHDFQRLRLSFLEFSRELEVLTNSSVLATKFEALSIFLEINK